MNLLKISQQDLNEMIKIHGNKLIRTAYLLLKDYHTAEEVVQDAFVKAYEKSSQLHDQEKLEKWLISIVYNMARSRMRRWSFHNIIVHDAIIFDQTEAVNDQPEEKLLKNFENKNLSQAIMQLNQKYRTVIVLYYYNDLSINEIAQLIHKNENTVKTQLSRARTQLKDKLIEGGYHGA